MIFTEEEKKQEEEWARQLKLCAGRAIWKDRHKKVPRGRETWAQWFGRKFGEDLDKFASRMAKKKTNEQKD